jgi:hypothetical protein
VRQRRLKEIPVTPLDLRVKPPTKAPAKPPTNPSAIPSSTPPRTVAADANPANKRRSQRVMIDIPVTISGLLLGGKDFVETTKTVIVNAHGGLITIASKIDPQKAALLVHVMTGNKIQCRVAYRKEIQGSRYEIGLEFASPSPTFWGISFPPEDWDPADRKKAEFPDKPGVPSVKGPIK